MKHKYIAVKERWAAKKRGQPPRLRSGERLPSGQREVKNFPVLDMGIQPEVAREEWRLKIYGLVENPVTLDWEQFMALEQFADTSDFHCVTTWSQYDMEWRGVSFFTLTELVKPKDKVTHVFYKGYDGYSTNTTLDAVMDDDTLIAHTWNGAPVSVEHGGPARVIIPKHYAWKGAKWVSEIIFLDQRHPRLLGSARLLQHRRPVDRRPVCVMSCPPRVLGTHQHHTRHCNNHGTGGEAQEDFVN